MPEQNAPNPTDEKNDEPPTIGARLAMSEEERGALPEDQQTISIEDMATFRAEEAETAATATATATAQRETAAREASAAATEKTRVLTNHSTVEQLLRSPDEKKVAILALSLIALGIPVIAGHFNLTIDLEKIVVPVITAIGGMVAGAGFTASYYKKQKKGGADDVQV